MISSKELVISGGTFSQISHNVQNVPTSPEGFKLLTQNVASQARHDGGQMADPAKCHPDTRLAILADLENWAEGANFNYPIKWITGSAGVGKTAIMRTTAQTLQRRRRLLASFFFWRTGQRCNTAHYFVATISYQISLSIPGTRPYIEQAIEADPQIFTRTLEAQIQGLIVDPIAAVHQEGALNSESPRMIIIDGLDECLDVETQSQAVEKQCEILRVLLWTLHQLPISFALLIASRPEHHIQQVFEAELKKYSSSIMLNDSHDATGDIRRFYDDKFREIREYHPLRSYLPLPHWPSRREMDDLVSRASGQFIYASTVIKFVGARKKNPSNQLNAILDSKVHCAKMRPLQALDLLYKIIFSGIDEEDLPATLRLLGILLVESQLLTRYKSPTFWDSFLGWQHGEVQRLLIGLESVLIIQLSTTDRGIFRFYHASLPEFLFDPSRSELFTIDRSLTYNDMVKLCIKNLSTPDDNIAVYMNQTMAKWFESAKPSAELEEAIKQGGLHVYPPNLRLGYPAFLCGIGRLEMKFPSWKGPELYRKKRDLYQTHLKKIIVRYYLTEDPLIYVVLAALGPIQLLSLKGYYFSGVSERFIHLPADLARIDQEEGLSLYGYDSVPSLKDDDFLAQHAIFAQEVKDIIKEMPERGHLFAKAASFFIKSLNQTRGSNLDHVGKGSPSAVLEYLLQNAPAQGPWLSECIKDHPIPRKLHGWQEMEDVIVQYLSKKPEDTKILYWSSKPPRAKRSLSRIRTVWANVTRRRKRGQETRS